MSGDRYDGEEGFWQAIEDWAYCLDGAHVDDRRDRIKYFLEHVPRPDPFGSLENFRKYAVLHLLSVWLAGPNPLAETNEQELAWLKASIESGRWISSPQTKAFLAVMDKPEDEDASRH
jgi:hypothetical protein